MLSGSQLEAFLDVAAHSFFHSRVCLGWAVSTNTCVLVVTSSSHRDRRKDPCTKGDGRTWISQEQRVLGCEADTSVVSVKLGLRWNRAVTATPSLILWVCKMPASLFLPKIEGHRGWRWGVRWRKEMIIGNRHHLLSVYFVLGILTWLNALSINPSQESYDVGSEFQRGGVTWLHKVTQLIIRSKTRIWL